VGRAHRGVGRARSPSNKRGRKLIESRPARIAIAIAAGLALADASIVVLALPPILADLDASVETVGAVIGVYTLALGLAAYAVTRWRGRPGAQQLGWVGMLGFAAASAGAGLAPSIALLIGLRALQGAAAAAVLVAAFELLPGARTRAGGAARGRRQRSLERPSDPRSAEP
jgi:MFS family permease